MIETSERWDVIVIGGGPAGIAAATALRERGIERVVLLERESEIGGAARHCDHLPYGIREFGRLMTGPAYARRLRDRAMRCGLQIRSKTSVVALRPAATVRIASPSGVEVVRARRVIIASGSRETPRAPRFVSGSRAPQIVTTGTLQQLLSLEGIAPFERPIIVGSEIVALSALLTCRRHGMRPVAIVEQRDRIETRLPLAAVARAMGVALRSATRLDSIGGARRVEFAETVDRRGVRQRIACDGVIFTGAFVPEVALAREAAFEFDSRGEAPVVDRFGRCSDPSYFLAGNVAKINHAAGPCYRDGGRVARFVADDLRGGLPLRASSPAD